MKPRELLLLVVVWLLATSGDASAKRTTTAKNGATKGTGAKGGARPIVKQEGGMPATTGRPFTFKAGESYALTFDLEPYTPGGIAQPLDLTAAQFSATALDAAKGMGMQPLPGSPVPGDPTHLQAVMAAPDLVTHLPAHFGHAVYLRDAVKLGPAIHGDDE